MNGRLAQHPPLVAGAARRHPPRMTACRGRALLGCLALVTAAAGCAPATKLEGWDVTLVPVVDCSQTNVTVDCADPTVLGQTSIRARWVLERSDTGIGVALTTHEGVTLPGWRFNNDTTVTAVPGCSGEGGECTFVRSRAASVDDNAGGCARESNRVFAGHVVPEEPDVLNGFFSDVAASSEECGTATTTEQTWSVVANRTADPVLARAEAP
jgi:hypothetical protein